MAARKCASCGSGEVVLRKTPERHFICCGCLHRSKALRPNSRYYRKLSGRSKNIEETLVKKNYDRIRFLLPYLKNGMRVLEFGCAEGFLGKAVKRKYRLSYSGIEVSADAGIAKTKLDEIWDSINKIPKGRKFDLILSFHVLEHIVDYRSIVSRCHRLLSKQGTLVIEVPYYFGNTRLPWDYHKEHIHLFSAASLVSLVEKQGFFIQTLSTGHYESALYNNSMRVVAGKGRGFKEQRLVLMGSYRRLLGERCVIYGVGGDFKALVAPYLDPKRIVAVIDGSPSKAGKRVAGKIVQPPEAIVKYSGNNILIATYRYEREILRYLLKKGIDRARIVTLEEIFDRE